MEYSNLRDNQINKIVTEIIDNFFGVENKINLNSTQIDELANKGLKEKNKILSTKGILNDKQYTLSELDLEIIKSVPQGGNWKNIPDKTIEKSKRLMKIRETGGRTTLYGRIDYTNPSYTITTYFNRPGNGCYIHPTQDRVLTTREGARIQCFPDDYYFYGNQRDILNQIGNAVPPLMGYLIAKKIKENLNVKKSLDLFSGAGGLLYGFKMAGVEHVLANDIDRSACVTLKINNPEVNVLCDDVTNDYTKEIIIDTAIKNNVDIICGGPPCQGFSLAGFRKSDDPRNKLVLDFADIIKSVEPKVFVFENVVGLLSYNKGETFNEIKKMFLTLGYKLHAETLDFSDYGVPQRRRRVIIIGVRNNINIEPSKL
ncbi:DNA (cytosine-5-)-methyltransferase, partial [Listeria monocytogenes]|nr:DNA (cytosine-5-)-methyltransferase [Listeria monocytogenes]